MKLNQARFHFVGVGGIGMCGLAELLFNMGATVSGSDAAENANTLRLQELGLKIYKGHKSSQVENVDVVVYSSAIQFTNPEIAEARARQIPLIPRAEALAEIMRLKRGLAVAGTHGKTTTTSMCSAIFLHANLSPTIVIGGRFDLINSTALLGEGEWLVAEADESDGSFHKLNPEIGIITNIDSDHLDHFKTFENLQKAFVDFALKIPFYGTCVVCGDDPQIRQCFDSFPKRIIYYGFQEHNDLILQGANGKYSLYRNDKLLRSKQKIGDFVMNVPGQHNALNAVAAMAAAMSTGLDFATCAQGIAKFVGVDRRFHFKGEKKNIKIYDDYGHHPTEVRAVLQAFREKFPQQRVVVYFQPHRYSRTQHCWHDFTKAFIQADLVYIGDIYAAGEAPLPGIDSAKLAHDLQHPKALHANKDKALSMIMSELKPEDVFVTLGAGDGWKLGMEILNQL
ncbi:MAG: UDP-N-acetylmuramate--L-alanine ligase [Pseudobdellovibrionaceae bacterium]